ncbi:MAG: hypothetical protein AABZ30_02505 [Myxococcota bacterium]
MAPLLATLAAPRAHAVDVGGSATIGEARSDSWSDGGHGTQNTWDWGADLALSGTPFRPGLLEWLAAADYHTLRTSYYPGFERADAWGLRAHTSLFGRSPVPVTLGASRNWTDFLAETGNVTRVGRTLGHTYAGTVGLLLEGYPALRALGSRNDYRNVSLDGSEAEGDSETLSLGLAHAMSRHSLQIDYDTAWSRGTYAETNYRGHFLNAQATAAPSDNVRFRLNERYYLRDPTVAAWTNPRYEDNTFGAGVQWLPRPQLTTSFDYGYRQLIVQTPEAPDPSLVPAPETPDRQSLAHSLGSSAYYQASPHYATYGNVALTYAVDRVGDEERRAAGQSLGAGQNWQRAYGPTTISAGGGANVGVVEESGGEARPSWGVNATTGLGHARERARGSATYAGSFTTGGTVAEGWTLAQQVQLTGERWLETNTWLHALLTVVGLRREDEFLGTYVNRSLMATLGADWSRYTANLTGGFTDTLASALAEPVSDGLLLPFEYNTRTWFLTAVATQAYLGGWLHFTEVARTLRIASPGRPDQYEHGGQLTASYRIGAFDLSLDERLSTGGTGDVRQTVNLVMVRLSRSFAAGPF